MFIFRCMFSGGVLEYWLCSLRGSNSHLCSWCLFECWNIRVWATEWCLGIYFSYVYLSSMLWQLTVCLGCYGNLFFHICPLLQVSDSLLLYLFGSLICIFPSVNYFVKILEAESEICDILLLVLKILMWLKIYMWYLVVIWVCVPFFKEEFFCEDWRKGCMWSLFFVWTRLKLF